MESILCWLRFSLWPYLTIIFLNCLVQTKPSDRDECPQNRDVCQLLCFCFFTWSYNVQNRDESPSWKCRKLSEDRTQAIGSFTLQAMRFGLVMLFTRENWKSTLSWYTSITSICLIAYIIYIYIYIYARVYIYIYTSCVCYLHNFFIVCVYYHHVLTFADFHFLFGGLGTQHLGQDLIDQVPFQWGWSGCFKWLGLPPLINHLQSWVILQVLGREWGNEALHGLRWGFIPSNPNRPAKYIYIGTMRESFTFFPGLGLWEQIFQPKPKDPGSPKQGMVSWNLNTMRFVSVIEHPNHHLRI